MGELRGIVRKFECSVVESINVLGFFPDITVKVDPEFQKFLDSGHKPTTHDTIKGEVFQTNHNSNRDDTIITEFGLGKLAPSVVVICSLLAYLGSDEGFSLLKIPKGEDEVNLILGYTIVEGVPYVLYIEHEFENGVEEIHLHIRDLNRWRKDTPMVAILKEK